MAENSGFFDANAMVDDSTGEMTFDRVYLAEAFAKYFASFLSNGVFGGKSNELQVLATTTPSMSVRVTSGQAFVNGYWYENTEDNPLPIQLASGVSPRIDTVVARWGKVERKIWVTVVTGTAAASPQEPPLLRNPDYFDLKLCSIYVNAGATSIRQQDITDTRLDRNVCGLVMGLVQQFDTTAFGAQLQTFINDYITTAQGDYSALSNSIDYYLQLVLSTFESFEAGTVATEQSITDVYNAFEAFVTNYKVSTIAEIDGLLSELRALLDDGDVGSLIDLLSGLATRIEKIELTVNNQITENVHTVLFDNIDNLIVEGFWNQELQRVEG